MRKSCAKLVEILCLGRGREHIMCTALGRFMQQAWVQARIFAHSTRLVCTAFPHPNIAFFPLLARSLSPLSTGPTTTTTIYIN